MQMQLNLLASVAKPIQRTEAAKEKPEALSAEVLLSDRLVQQNGMYYLTVLLNQAKAQRNIATYLNIIKNDLSHKSGRNTLKNILRDAYLKSKMK